MITYAAHRTSPSGHQPVYRVVMNGDNEVIAKGLLSPEPSREVNDYSTDFNFSYGGSGPTQLALALLLDATGDPEEAQQHCADFVYDFVTQWKDTWQITDQEIKDWLVMQKGGLIAQVSLN